MLSLVITAYHISLDLEQCRLLILYADFHVLQVVLDFSRKLKAMQKDLHSNCE